MYPGLNILLEGPSGTGKTYSISTFADTGLEVFYLALEPGLETLIGAFTDHGKEVPANFHWHYLAPAARGFESLRLAAYNAGMFNLSALTKMTDPNRGKHNPFVEVYDSLNNFKDDRTGKEYGSVDSWDNSRVLVIDHFTALSKRAMEMMVGTKPVQDKPDYGIAQNNIMNLLDKLINGCACHFVMLAHVDREIDEVMGGVKLMVSTIGNAIRSKVPIGFSDVILSSREGDRFYWDTANAQADLKTRNLPIASKLPPDFKQIIAKWKERKAAAERT